MIGKGRIGSGFGGLGRYLLTGSDGRSPERVEWTSARNLPFDAPELAPSIMRATADQNARVEKPVYHLSINWAHEDSPSRLEMEETADRVLRDLGLHEHQALLVAHNDTHHRHVHIMVNRVHPETLRTWHHGHDWRRIEESLRRIEKERGWRVVPGRQGRIKEAPREKAEALRNRAKGPMHDARSWADLEAKLARERLGLRARGRGLVVTDGRHYVKASSVHRSFSRPQLEERFRQSYRGWRDEVRKVHRLTRKHQRMTSPRRAARTAATATATPKTLHRKAQRLRHRAHTVRRGLDGAGDTRLIERQLKSFAFRFGMETLRRVSPAAATILTTARTVQRTLGRERGERSR